MFVSNGFLVDKKTPTLIPTSYPAVDFPPMSGLGYVSAYSQMYIKHLWVNIVISKRARATARLPLVVYQDNGQDRPRDKTHPYAVMLKTPNPAMSSFDLWLWTSSTFDIYGEAFLYKLRTNGRVFLFPFHPRSMTRDDKTGKWTFDNGTSRMEDIDREDLVHFKTYNPDSLHRGLSNLEPLRSTLDNEWHARNATSSFWQRGARPGMFLTHQKNMSKPAATRLKEQMDTITAGSGKTGVTVVLEEGMTPHPMTLTAEEAQYIETRKLNREEVCAQYDIPPPVVHILDRATFSNITEQMRSMYRDTMAPHLKGFEATIEREVRAVEWPDDNVYAEFLMDEVLRGDFETRTDALNKANHMTIAEKRKVENLPFIEGTDRIFLNTASLPIDAIDARAEAMTARLVAGGDPVHTESLPNQTVRSVMGRLNQSIELGQIQPKALVKGLDERDTGIVLEALNQERLEGGDIFSLRDRIRTMVKE